MWRIRSAGKSLTSPLGNLWITTCAPTAKPTASSSRGRETTLLLPTRRTRFTFMTSVYTRISETSTDEIAFGRLDGHSTRLEVLDPTVQLVRLAGDLQQHPALVARHGGTAAVRDDLHLAPELVDDRLLHQRRTEHQLQPPSSHEA